MNLIMFIVGTVIFSAYIFGVVWNIGFSIKKSKEEYGYYSRHHQPEQDELE